MPALLGEGRDRRAGLAMTTVLTAIGFAGCGGPATGPGCGSPALGIGHGGLFTLVLTLPVVVSHDAAKAGRISAMAFFVGYACAGLAPLLVGALRDATGDFHLAFGLLGGLTAAMCCPSPGCTRRRAAERRVRPGGRSDRLGFVDRTDFIAPWRSIKPGIARK